MIIFTPMMWRVSSRRTLAAPRSAEVYNLGGGKSNSCSIMEAFQIVESLTGIPMKHRYSDKSREGDHICYFSDLRKARSHFPNWELTKPLEQTIGEIVNRWMQRRPAGAS